jgi:hypothetical protein
MLADRQAGATTFMQKLLSYPTDIGAAVGSLRTGVVGVKVTKPSQKLCHSSKSPWTELSRL